MRRLRVYRFGKTVSDIEADDAYVNMLAEMYVNMGYQVVVDVIAVNKRVKCKRQ